MELAPYEPGPADRAPQEGTDSASYAVPGVASLRAERQFRDLWDLHGRSVYALACTLLGDDEAAVEAVTLGLTDLARSTDRVSGRDARRSMARHIYWRSRELVGETPGAMDLPPAMVWLGQLAQLQRACLALCVWGGHTYRETADLLGVPPLTVAELLTTGLREIGRLSAGDVPASA